MYNLVTIGPIGVVRASFMTDKHASVYLATKKKTTTPSFYARAINWPKFIQAGSLCCMRKNLNYQSILLSFIAEIVQVV
jgi:hypothetical protein